MLRPRGLEEIFYNGIYFVSATWFRRDTILVTLNFRFNDLSHTFWSWGTAPFTMENILGIVYIT
jgi:hypothetical protein